MIEGTGEVGNSSLTLINGGTIDANSLAGTGTLILNGWVQRPTLMARPAD